MRREPSLVRGASCPGPKSTIILLVIAPFAKRGSLSSPYSHLNCFVRSSKLQARSHPNFSTATSRHLLHRGQVAGLILLGNLSLLELYVFLRLGSVDSRPTPGREWSPDAPPLYLDRWFSGCTRWFTTQAAVITSDTFYVFRSTRALMCPWSWWVPWLLVPRYYRIASDTAIPILIWSST